MVKTDTTDEPTAITVDNGGGRFGRKLVVATAIALSHLANLRPGELATLRVRNLV